MSAARRVTAGWIVLAAALSVADMVAAGQPMIGEQAPGFDLPTTAGERVQLEGLRGRLIVLHFGAGW